ncbi:MAG: isoamylase early set domain-containing protein [Ferruginibacter sp.]|nr:isoamylase early set domain-containing protein [Ferruginibacter sp.]
MAKKVTFTLSAEVVGEATSGLLLCEFNNWDYNDGINLKKQKDGSMTATTSLETGNRYEYRYLLNDGRWVNDHSAEHYVHISGFHVENCVINVAQEAKKTVAEKKVTTAPEKVVTASKKTVKVKEKSLAVKVVAPPKKTTAKPTASKTDKSLS